MSHFLISAQLASTFVKVPLLTSSTFKLSGPKLLANKDLPVYDESRDLLKVVEEEEHKLRKEEVRRRFIKGIGYRKARRSKPYPPQGRMSCCGGGRKADDSLAIESEEVDRELRKLARHTRGGYGRYNSSRETDEEVRGSELGGQVAIEPLSQFCQDELGVFGRGGGSSSNDECSSEDRVGCSREEPLVVFA